MSFFDRFRKASGAKPSEPDDAFLRQKLVELVFNTLRDKNGRIRIEDAISAAATIVAERCIDAAGDYPLRDHELVPGSRAFSTKVNELISGDVSEGDVNQIPSGSVVGMLRSRLDMEIYKDTDFPALSEVFKGYAARIGNPADWGKVPLSVGPSHLPFVPPLQVGFVTRDRVDEILSPVREDKMKCLTLATESLAEILVKIAASGIDRRLALTLAIETINGMAKTAPMTAKAMQQAQNRHSQKTG